MTPKTARRRAAAALAACLVLALAPAAAAPEEAEAGNADAGAEVGAASAGAETAATSAEADAANAGAEAAAASASALRFLHDYNERHLLAAADEIPAADYAFRPTAEVRSVAELLGHVADVQFLLCSSARGEANPSGTGDASIEKTHSEKAEVAAALRASFDYCDAVYSELDGEGLARPARDGGSAAGALTLNVYHAGQHYGHLTVAMRLKGLTPPSSRPRDDAPAAEGPGG
jgi:uncharacterized damage-inducible protein DinB